MTLVVPLRSMRNEASEWLARLQSEYATDEDQSEFEAWAAADPRRREVYAQLAGTWRRLESMRDFREALMPLPVADRQSARWRLPAMAAGLAALAVSAAFFVAGNTSDAFQTAVGEQRRVALTDASTLELNTNSKVTVDFSSGERAVRLERGEARFKVIRQPQRPFVVKAGDRLIRVLGTEFNVRLEDGAVKVLVVEGMVSVAAASGGQALTLRAGQSIDTTRVQRVVTVAPEELERRLAWHDGMVSFQGETLREVLAELSRYNPVQFDVADEAAANLRVSGYFRATDVPTFLTRLETNFPVRVRHEAGRTVIVSR